MLIGRIVQIALPDRQGVILAKEGGIDTMFRYNYTPTIPVTEGDYVRGEVYGFIFSVLYRVNSLPCPVFYVDFKSGTYTKEDENGQSIRRVNSSSDGSRGVALPPRD